MTPGARLSTFWREIWPEICPDFSPESSEPRPRFCMVVSSLNEKIAIKRSNFEGSPGGTIESEHLRGIEFRTVAPEDNWKWTSYGISNFERSPRRTIESEHHTGDIDGRRASRRKLVHSVVYRASPDHSEWSNTIDYRSPVEWRRYNWISPIARRKVNLLIGYQYRPTAIVWSILSPYYN